MPPLLRFFWYVKHTTNPTPRTKLPHGVTHRAFSKHVQPSLARRSSDLATTLPAVLNQANDVRETRYRHWLFAGKHWISRDWILRRADINNNNNNNKEDKNELLRKRGRKGSYGEGRTQWARWMEREKRYIGKTVCNELVAFYTHSQNKCWCIYNQDERVSTNRAC